MPRTSPPSPRPTTAPRPRGAGRGRLARAAAVSALLPLLALTACASEEPAAVPSPDPAESASAAPTDSASPSASASPTPTPEPVEPSDDLDAITVTGGFGEAPEVEVDAPWAVDQTRTKVLSEGDGTALTTESTAELNYYGVNARTGEVFDQSFERGQTAVFPLNQVVPGFSKGLDGQEVGSRVLIAMPGEDGYDASGGNPQAGIELGDTLLFVVDVVGTQLEGPEGKEVEPRDGLPTVSGPVDEPTVEVPDTEPPAELVVQPLIEGEGKEITATDVITVDYQGVLWDGGQVVENSFAAEPETGPLSSLIPGWQQGLVGQKVGSRVLLVVPPAQAFPEGNATPSIPPGQTMVYVVDVLFAQPGQ